MTFSSNSYLKAEKLYKSFNKRPILKGVDIGLVAGETVGLLGPNGAGKTTCFSIIAGLIRPDDGNINLNHLNITKFPLYQRARLGIGYLPQESSIFRGLNVEQNIRAILEITEKDPEIQANRLELLLDEFSIRSLRHSSALALSGGERRRVEIARALAGNPQFLLLDEPFAGIDPVAVIEIRELISHLNKRGIGVLITDHNVRETLEIVTRAYILSHGVLLMEGTPQQIVDNHEVRRLYLGENFNL